MIQRADGKAPTAPANRLSQEDLRAMAPIRAPRREIHVGLFVVLGLLAVLTALFALTDPGTFRGRYHVYTMVKDAGGIRKGDPVRMKGVNIGRIRDFEIQANGVRVAMEMEKEFTVPADSKISIVSGGLLQSMVAVVEPGTSAQRVADGAVLPNVEQETLSQSAEQIAANGDSVLIRAQRLLNDKTIDAVGGSAQDMQALLRQLTVLAAEQRIQLAQLTTSLTASARGFEASATRPELARAIARTDSMTIRLDAASASLQSAGQSLASLTARIDRGEGTLGKLTQDDQLYQNLNNAVNSLNELTADIKANPRRYINVRVF
ncbi:MAG TPA: MlaD family protein [Longimicrobium sp.]|jgi:phospholipid/cholesterol/gamma-HCH transport system substrate-binding protein|uniref:MlaD family protein n=1 Tax=Longimicrobium sp. TaxID=2029185 RepID=UPI002ED7C90F